MENNCRWEMDGILCLPESDLLNISKENSNRIILTRLISVLVESPEKIFLPEKLFLQLLKAQVFHANYRLTLTGNLTYAFESDFRKNNHIESDSWSTKMSMNKDVFKQWMDDYPGLSQLFTFIFHTEIENFRKICQCFINDYDLLISKGWVLENYSNVTDVHVITSETHNGGKNVLMVITDGQPSFALKPRYGELEDKISRFIATYVHEYLSLPEWPLPEYIVAGDHFWTSWCRFKACGTFQEAEKFHYHSGVLAALSLALATVDLNCENIIACGEYIIPVDLECALHHQRNIDNHQTSLPEWSVLKTGLLTTVIYVDSEIMSDPSGAAFLGRIYKNDVTHRAADNSYNLSYGNIAAARIWDCKSKFINGFRDCYLSIIENKRVFLDFIHTSKYLLNRYIRRKTSEYSEILEASLNPSLMSNSDRRYQYITSSLSQPGMVHERKMINAEVQSIFNGEIPLFNSSPGTSYVEGYSLSGQAVLSNITTGCDTASSYINGMTVDTLRKEIHLIEENIDAVKNVYIKKNTHHAPSCRVTDVSETYDIWINELLALLKKIENGDQLVGFYGNSKGYYYGKMDASLATGLSGVLLGAKITFPDDARISHFAEEVILNICSDIEKSTSVFVGGAHVGFMSSLLPLSYALGLNAAIVRKYFSTTLLDLLIKQHDEIVTKFDYHNGSSGILAVASVYAAIFNDADWCAYCDRLYEDLISTGVESGDLLLFPTSYGNSSHPEGILSGISHGQSGTIYAIALYGVLFPTNKERALNILSRLVPVELNCFSDTLQGWPDLRSGALLNVSPSAWLHGASGILMVLDYVAQHYDIPILSAFRKRVDVRKIFNSALKNSLESREVGIVHGPAGIMMSLNRLSQTVDPYLLEQYIRAAESTYRCDIAETMTLLTGKLGDLILIKEFRECTSILPLFPHEYLKKA